MTVPVDRGSGDRMAEPDATAPAESVGSAHGAAVHTCNREGRERPTDDRVSL
jgi:hypothetical protein